MVLKKKNKRDESDKESEQEVGVLKNEYQFLELQRQPEELKKGLIIVL
jgi:hypothetical protein